MVKLYHVFVSAVIVYLSCPISAALVNFEDLSERQDISGSTRYDIDWDFGNQGAFNLTGSWAVPDNPGDEDYYNSPHSGTKNINNSWGCTEIGFQFPVETFEYGVIVTGAWFAVQGYKNNWAEAIWATGYKDDEFVWQSDLLLLSPVPQLLTMSELPVDRVVISALSKTGNNYGYYGMDDLSYEVVIIPEPLTLLLLALGGAAFRRK